MMDRRDFLRAATATVATASAMNIGTAAADRPEPSRLWREYLAAPDRHPRIPNVSYAGYHRGERPLPCPPVGRG